MHISFSTITASLFFFALLCATFAFEPQLRTTIRSSNGTDITSSFQTRVFWVPQPEKIVATPDLTGRGQDDQPVRYLHDCSTPNARFVGSLCQYKADIAGTMQQYIIYCQERQQAQGPFQPNYGKSPQSPERIAEHGACEVDEVCMPGRKSFIDGVKYYTAACVKKSSFQIDHWATKAEMMGQAVLENRTVSAVLSEQQGQTPLEAASMEISAVEVAEGIVQEKNCTDCVEIRTAPLPDKVKGLNLQAWMDFEKVKSFQFAGVLYLLINFIG